MKKAYASGLALSVLLVGGALLSGSWVRLEEGAASEKALDNSLCPSSPSWTYCAKEGNNCLFDFEGRVTVAYGEKDTDTWVFEEVFSWGQLKIKCSDGQFGNPKAGSSNHCCWYNGGSLVWEDEDAYTQGNWQYLGTKDKLSVPTAGKITWVFFGVWGEGGVARLFTNEFKCNTDYFADAVPDTKNDRQCYYYKKAVYELPADSKWENCGNNKVDTCSLDKQAVVRLVQYGREEGSSAKDNANFRFVSAASDGVIKCKSDLFDTPVGTSGKTKYCYVEEPPASLFSNPVAYWKVSTCTGDCDGISGSYTEGVESTSTYATTTSWGSSLATTVSTSASFGVDDSSVESSVSVTSEVSTEISESFEESYTQYAESTCEVACGSSTKALYQWTLNTEEVNGFEIDSFATYSCHYICSVSGEAPQCPYGYCANDDCTTCTSY